MNMWKLLVILAVIKIKLQGDSRSNELPSISEGLAQYLSGLKVDKVTKLSFSTVCTKSAGMRDSENDKIQSYDNVFKSIGGKVY